MTSLCETPLLNHELDADSAFTPDDLLNAVRVTKNLPNVNVPAVCVLDFDGDLTDWLIQKELARPFVPWACFHTTMYSLDIDGICCGIIPRTIGGPYSVLIAEQLHVAGAGVILGLTSAGRVSPSLPLPSFVAVTAAVRDEGTSLHYLPPSSHVCCPTPIADLLTEEVSTLGPTIQGTAWTTDAPYRETSIQLQRHAEAGVLAVEMQAASLFAFATARQAAVGVIAHVTNAIGHHEDEQFEKGTDEDSFQLLQAMVRAGGRFLNRTSINERQRISACGPAHK